MSSLIFPSGAYQYVKHIFELLEEGGIVVQEQDRYFEHMMCFDLEAVLAPINEASSGKTKYNRVHRPLSCSICYNVNGFAEPLSIVNEDPHSLVQKIFAHFDLVITCVSEQTQAKWVTIYNN